MRLGKYLAHAGVASRRAAEEIVRSGRVRVAGKVVSDPARSVTEASEVTLDGRPVGGPEPRVVYALNKPAGVVSTARDPHGRPTVVALVGDGGGGRPGGRDRGGPGRGDRGAPTSAGRRSAPRLYPVGRLDADTTGLILLTNDGELAHALLHPSRRVPRTYRARVGGGRVGEGALRALRLGVDLEDGRTALARVRRLEDDVLELVIHEGRKRQVRRMCEAVGHPVLELERVAFGPLRLGRLGPGKSRRLSGAEIERLRAAAGTS
jgi:23S rRNA pseudouridine2605 synthase